MVTGARPQYPGAHDSDGDHASGRVLTIGAPAPASAVPASVDIQGSRRRLRIGMFGLRGLRPDLEISGFETAFAEIAPRLVARGHDVTIYCRRSAYSPSRRVARDLGVRLEHMPSPGGKNLSAVTSAFFAVMHGLARREFDVWFFVNVGMGHHCALARLSGRPVVMNVDGLDWRRSKWGPVARAYFYSAAH